MRSKIDLESDANSTKAVSVSISGNTVYVAGMYNNQACFWQISGGTRDEDRP